MRNLLKKHNRYFHDRNFVVALVMSLVFLAIALIVDIYANTYAVEKASNAVADIFLSNIQPFNVGWIFAYGAIVFWIIIIFLGIIEPRRFPFALKSVALFVFIRSIFITLTHVGPFPTQIIPADPSYIIQKAVLGADLFFSAHTGLPFLMALVFWENRRIRIFCIISSVFFGMIALLGHFHYSIDVLSAFFITYAIYRLAEKFFKKDRVLFLHGIPEVDSVNV